jgi:uncharacterized repeat protein (TIGR01451 family)
MAAFYNQATLSYNGSVAVSNITTGEIIETLSAAKEAVTDTYTTGSDTVFAVSLVNSGTADFTGLTLTDNLGEYSYGDPAAEAVPLTYREGSAKYYINGVQQAEPTVTSSAPLVISGITVPAGGSTMILYEAEVNRFAPFGEGASITNTAEISGVAKAILASASTTITPESGASLTIAKSLSPAEVAENGEVTYTFIIQNSGSVPVTADDSVVFTDVFAPVLDITSVTFNGTDWSEGTNYNYVPASGTFTVPEGQITVPAAEYTQNPDTGEWNVQPGAAVLVITGNITVQ